MPMSPLQVLASTFLPNHVKLKTPVVVIAAIERKEKSHFEGVWKQAFVTHDPKFFATTRDGFRIGVIDLPAPKDMGDTHFVALVVKQGDPGFSKLYTLEHDYVLKTKSNRTLVCERVQQQHTKHFEGPAVSGDFAKDAPAFVDAFLPLLTKK
jgi:hypothetical protein